ncbi:MAG: FAD-dependent oxidoreductase [Deltaproteobacteria bacterium]|nr:MAG: FAD-dependent oxidoreductase [Deltaproteobacteria bacterium]
MYHKTETLVIGGGVIGICCAFYLNALGKNVTVVEKGDICSGSSYGNAGLIVPSYSIPLAAPGVVSKALKWMFNPESPFYIKPRFHREFLTWLWKFHSACNESHLRRAIPVLRDLSLASLSLFDELAALEGIHFGYEKNGIVEIFNTPRGFEEAVNDIRLLQKYGIENRILQSDDLKEFTQGMQTTAVGSIFLQQDAHLIPDQLVHQLARHIEQKGVDLLTSVEVLGFETSGRKVITVRTTRGDIIVEEVILAGGYGSADIARELKIRLLIEPAKGYSITFKRPPRFPGIPFAMAEAKVILTPMADTLRFAGTLELAGFDMSINQRRVQAILKAVPAYFPDIDLDALELIEIWRGLRPCTPDGLPYLGRSRLYDNFIIATGHGMLGISLAPVTGKIVSQLVADEIPTFDLNALSLERFN